MDPNFNEMSIRQINKYFREKEKSEMHKWPIRGRFNPADRAIRKLRKLRQMGLDCNPGLEYALSLERLISEIVNKEV